MNRFVHLGLAFGLTLLVACGGSSETPPPTVAPDAPLAPTASATETARRLMDTAEGHLTNMSLELNELIRGQAWFATLSEEHLDLVGAILRTERAAKARGETHSVHDMLSYASEQGWYGDGLDQDEARGLRGAFEAYERSLTGKYAPAIGPVLATTLEFGLFRATELPEGGEMIVVVSADDPETGNHVLDRAIEWLPRIEELVGAYPYSFLHLMVTDLGEMYAGLSYDEFIALSPDYVDDGTIVHELTHSTLYGAFPTWFEEGFAYFMEGYLTDSGDDVLAMFAEQLALMGYDHKLYVGFYRDGSQTGWWAEQMQGFLFMTAVHEINGIDALIGTVRQLRTKSLGDQELLRAFVSHGTPEEQRRMQEHFCQNVVGTSRNYCPPERPF